MRARLHLVEQPAVFNRDDRLVGEGSDQVDMFVGERLNSAAREENNANRNTLAKQWHAERRPIVSDAYDSAQLVFGIGLNVRDLDRSLLQQNSTDHRSPARLDLDALEIFYIFHLLLGFAGNAEACGKTERGAVGPPDIRHIRLAQPGRGLDECLQNRPQVEGRAADDLQHVGRCALLLPRFLQLAGENAYLVLQVGDGWCRNRASLWLDRAPTLHGSLASTTSLHFAPLGWVTTRPDLSQIMSLLLCRAVRSGQNQRRLPLKAAKRARSNSTTNSKGGALQACQPPQCLPNAPRCSSENTCA